MYGLILHKFLSTIDEHRMLTGGESVLLALSGGIDSTVMAHLFNEIKKEYNLTLYAFHLNHKLRPKEAEEESEFVNRLCADLGIKVFSEEYEVKKYAKANKLSLQVAARQVRYNFLNKIKSEHGLDKVATAHNADDRVETVLIRLLRGTAGSNISGLSPVRSGYIIRPLIDIFREEIDMYAGVNRIHYMIDSSNQKTKYLRNKVRLELIPYIKRNYNPNIMRNILSFAKTLKLEDDFIDEAAIDNLNKGVVESGEKYISFSTEYLKKCNKALVNRIITIAFYRIAQRGHSLYFNHIENINHIIGSEKPNLSYSLPGGVVVRKSYDLLYFSTVEKAEAIGYEYRHDLDDCTVILEAGVTIKSELVTGTDFFELIREKKDNEEYVDSERVTFPVKIRNFQDGDYIVPLNMKGRKKLKNLFIDKKIPLYERRALPILTSKGEIFLLPGICVSNDYKVTKETKAAVKFTCLDET